MIETDFDEVKKFSYFFNDYIDKSPEKVMFFMIVSCGFYLIYWMYKLCDKFNEFDESISVDSQRVIAVTLILPCFWFLLNYFLKLFFFGIGNFDFGLYIFIGMENLSYWSLVFCLFEILGWSFIFFMVFVLFVDFCDFFCKITRDSPFIWFVFLSGEVFFLVLVLFEYFYLFPIVFFTFIAVPAMQASLNRTALRYSLVREKYSYIKVGRQF